MTQKNENTIDKLKTSQVLVQSLVDLFSFPGSEYLNRERMNQHKSNFSEISINDEIISYFNQISNLFTDESLQSYMVEYARLFVGPYHVVAPPYGSYYLENGRIMGDTTVKVNQFYDNAGLSINETFKDLPDHVVAELEFILFLIHNELQFLEKSELDNFNIISKLKIEFFNTYFYSWIKTFSNIILEKTESEWYRLIAKYTSNVTEILFYQLNNNIKN